MNKKIIKAWAIIAGKKNNTICFPLFKTLKKAKEEMLVADIVKIEIKIIKKIPFKLTYFK